MNIGRAMWLVLLWSINGNSQKYYNRYAGPHSSL